MPDIERWMGGIEARIAQVEKRIDSGEANRAQLGDAITNIRIDMSALRSDISVMTKSVSEAVVKIDQMEAARAEDARVLATDLKSTLKERRLTLVQILVTIVGGILVTSVGGLLIFALTGGH